MIEELVKYAKEVLSSIPTPRERAMESMSSRSWNPFFTYTKPNAGFGRGDMRDFRLPHEQWYRDIAEQMMRNRRPIVTPEQARELMRAPGGMRKLRSYTTPTEIDTPWYVDLFT